MEATVPIELGNRSYSIHVGSGLVGSLGERLSARTPGRTALVVTDDVVGPLHAESVHQSLVRAGFSVVLETVPSGERSKTLGRASRLFDCLVDCRADRQTMVVAVGGGVVGDLAGFVAATYARGIPFAPVPTTLLAMVDASVGGKVAVDHPRGKNLIGAFHQPVLVVCDLLCLGTLPPREYRCGLAEVVKYGAILDAEFFAYLEEQADALAARDLAVLRHVVTRCCQLKARVVEQDERDTSGPRALLNYGHTFAHAFEVAARYEQLRHGEAVAIGMMCAARLAARLGRVGAELVLRQRRLWERLGLPTRLPAELLDHDLVGLMRTDKKAQGGKLRFVLPAGIGAGDVTLGIDETLVHAVLREAATT